MTVRHILPAAVLAALTLGACTASGPTAEVKRFYLPGPVTRGTIALIPADSSGSFSLEYRTYADAVAAEFRNQGFTPVASDAGPAYIATLAITQNVAVGPRRPSPVSIGIGGGGFSGGRGGGVGIGGGVAFPVGHGSQNATEFDRVGVQIKRAADQSLIWEGSAQAAIDTRSPQASLARAVPALARALLAPMPIDTGDGRRGPTATFWVIASVAIYAGPASLATGVKPWLRNSAATASA